MTDDEIDRGIVEMVGVVERGGRDQTPRRTGLRGAKLKLQQGDRGVDCFRGARERVDQSVEAAEGPECATSRCNVPADPP